MVKRRKRSMKEDKDLNLNKKIVDDSAKTMETSIEEDELINKIVDDIVEKGDTSEEVKLDPDEVPKHLQERRKRLAELKSRRRRFLKEEDEIEDMNEDETDDGGYDIDLEDLDDDEEDVDDTIDEPTFDVEDDLSDLEGEEDLTSDNIDEIIMNLIKKEDMSIDIDEEDGEITISDLDDEDPGISEVTGLEDYDDEDYDDEDEEVFEEDMSIDIDEENGEIKISDLDEEDPGISEVTGLEDQVDEEMDAEIEEAEKEEGQVREQMDEMIKTFSKSYPKIFNEQFVAKLQLIIEMYTNAKAKKQSTKKVKTVLESVNKYMKKLERDFKVKNRKALKEAVDIRKKEMLLKRVKGLLENKLGKAGATDKNVKQALIKLYKENKSMKRKMRTIRENNFLYKTNMIFERATSKYTNNERNLISNILEGIEFKNTKEFKTKLKAALSVVKDMRKDKVIAESKKRHIATRKLRAKLVEERKARFEERRRLEIREAKMKKMVAERKRKERVEEMLREKKERLEKRQRPVRRSDGIITSTTIKESIKKRRMSPVLNEQVDNDNPYGINFEEMEKYIP